jgi:hypothetical protein
MDMCEKFGIAVVVGNSVMCPNKVLDREGR